VINAAIHHLLKVLNQTPRIKMVTKPIATPFSTKFIRIFISFLKRRDNTPLIQRKKTEENASKLFWFK
jgi:hypothetical protein